MITIITGAPSSGKSLVAKGIAAVLHNHHGRRVFIFHDGASADDVKSQAANFDDVLVCVEDTIFLGLGRIRVVRLGLEDSVRVAIS